MWSKNKSVFLSLVLTGMTFVLLLAAVVFLQRILDTYSSFSGRFFDWKIKAALYISSAPGLICAVALFKMLLNIQKNEIFILQNVKILRILSWCCIFVGLEYALVCYNYILMLLVAFAAVFFGIILRVIKNVFENAIVLREENELTV